MELELANIPEFEEQHIDLPHAAFLDVAPDFSFLEETAKKFAAYRALLIVGNGGSITSNVAIIRVLNQSGKRVEFLNTVDPERIAHLKGSLAKDETLVIAISKSGETVSQIEALMHFLDYPLLFITGKGSALDSIGKKARAHFIEHPDIGGRYTAFTNVGMVPAAICGIDVRALWTGAQRVYSQYANPKNPAMRAAQAMWSLEQSGIVDVFMPFYSNALFSASNLIVQLCHESFGKAGLGQTYFVHEAPESQHHTNQRFFGGRRNIAAFFVHVENFRTDAHTLVPAAMHSIHIRDGSLFGLNKLPLSFSMEAEFRGTLEDAKVHGIPCAVQNVLVLDAAHLGEFIAFWQLYAVYSAVLRGVDPFDQPQVETSKKISWTKRKAYHEHA